MAKIQFTARKDPLLRDRSPVLRTAVPNDPAPIAAKREPPQPSPPTGKDPLAPRRPNAASIAAVHEEPAGVVAVAPTTAPRAISSPAEPRLARPPAAEVGGTRGVSPAENLLSSSGRRYQTSVSLPAALWGDFDVIARDAGISTGELLTAVLRNGLPESPESALDALERLLDQIPPDEGLLEERNYRLPLELRQALDRLAKILALGPRGNRSLLVRAILVDRPLATAQQARELVNALRVQAMRVSVQAAASSHPAPLSSS